MFSRHAAASGNTAAIRSSASIRCSCGAHLACRRGCAAPPARCVVFQRQRVWNTGASSNACTSTSRAVLGMQIAEDVGERERVLRPEREQQRVLGRRRLQLEVELPAESLAQREAPRLVDAAAERRVQHELHAAGLVEEPLEDERLLRRDRRRAPRRPSARYAISLLAPHRRRRRSRASASRRRRRRRPRDPQRGRIDARRAGR